VGYLHVRFEACGCHQLQVGARHGEPANVPFPVILCFAYEPGSACDSKAVEPSHCCTCNVLTDL
jgi:hypothetical protein